MKYSLDDLRKVKGIGRKTIERIKEQFDDSEYISKYDESIHIEPGDLVQGDMLEVMNGIPDGSIDMILTDLPYGTTACSWDSVIDFDKLWKQYNRVIKPNGAIVLFGSEPFSTNMRISNLDNYKYDWLWVKTKGVGFLNANRQPLRKTERISVFYKEQPTYNPQGLVVSDKKNKCIVSGMQTYGDTNQDHEQEVTYKNYPNEILKFDNDVGIHPTQKPVALLEYLIKTYTDENKNEVVLDSTMGSGSTGVACKNTSRQFIGIELDEEYFNIAKERINNT